MTVEHHAINLLPIITLLAVAAVAARLFKGYSERIAAAEPQKPGGWHG